MLIYIHIKTKINLSALYMSKENPDTDKAMLLLDEAYKANSEDFSINNNLGTAYMQKENYPMAISFYKAALGIKNDDEDALFNLANAQVKNGDLSDAISNFTQVTAKDSENLEAYVGLAKAQLQAGDAQGSYKNLLYVRGKNPSFRKAEVDSLIALIEDSL